jgi:hypothetical protein
MRGVYILDRYVTMRALGVLLLLLVLALIGLIAWAWWFYRPTIEFTSGR